jgi:prolyl-tRNA synthetase
VLVRGDHRINEIKLQNALGAAFRPAHEEEIASKIGPPGFIGPVDANVPVLLDDAIEPGRGYVVGANREHLHLRGVEPGRDFPFKRGDVRSVEAGDTVNGHPITIEPAIEIGNIFKLGQRFSEPLGAKVLDASGSERTLWMGSYGIGPARIMAAAVEQYADENGISWPKSLAPWDVHLVGLGKPGTEERELLYDDRDGGPGMKFADAELLGCPLRLTIGGRTMAGGEIEAQVRRGQEARSLPLEGAAEAAAELWRSLD